MSNRELPPDQPSPINVANAIERQKRRDLSLRAVDHLSEIFEAEVSFAALVELSEEDEASPARLIAKRARRAVAAVGREDSEIVKQVGPSNLYHYMEAVVVYGAADKYYIRLMEAYGLTAEEATGIYALREIIAENTDGSLPGLGEIIDALNKVGISPQQAGLDPEEAMAAFDEAGFIIDHAPYEVDDKIIVAQFSRPIFYPQKGHTSRRLVDDDVDGSVTRGIREELREQLGRPVEENEIEDETQQWHRNVIGTYLKNLDS